MLREIKNERPTIKLIRFLLRLDEENLIQGNLLTHQIQLWKDFKDTYEETLVILKSAHRKELAFYIPFRFKKEKNW